jgi:hypothetical protein
MLAVGAAAAGDPATVRRMAAASVGPKSGRKCGSPPETRCTPEGPNAGAADAARFGIKAIESKQLKGAVPK